MDEETRGILRLISEKLDKLSQILVRIELRQIKGLTTVVEPEEEKKDG